MPAYSGVSNEYCRSTSEAPTDAIDVDPLAPSNGPTTKDDAQPTVPVSLDDREVDVPVVGSTPNSMDVDAPVRARRAHFLPSSSANANILREAFQTSGGRPPSDGTTDVAEVVPYPHRPHSDSSPLLLLTYASEPTQRVIQDMRKQRMSLCWSLFAHHAITQGSSMVQVDEEKRHGRRSNARAHPHSHPHGTVSSSPSRPQPMARPHRPDSTWARATQRALHRLTSPFAPNAADPAHSANPALSHKPLQSCHALLNDLFLLASSCPIRTLYIKGPTFIVKAIRACAPLPRIFDVGVMARGIVRVMGRACTLQIECLEATLIAGYHAATPADVDTPAIVDGLVAAVGSLPALRVLAVSVLCHLLADPPCAAEAFMRALDLDAFAHRLCVVCPTLQTVFVLLSGVRGRANERMQLGPQCTEFDLYADRKDKPGHRGTEAVGDEISAEPCDVEREAGEVSSEGAVQDELRSSRGWGR
ncbi:uncharacterized protein BXZ73DRAFT_107157 [Epithele typhae]|uniref:uncharacterized protein n=1 Tax=Epithele typhae TaxID=378194 RepID=UPI0020089A4F|nr:uncharacterized protein BXZ73DRAFT_107157 [Epithele typhae]KAH9912922.1 hypothetical protein BXZ73DRAFT_107157 [Epithele typhae]